jgi:hypothetical protein
MKKQKLKTFRFKKPEVFNLPPAAYYAVETPKGYVIKISDKDWIGLPKSIVEGAPETFELTGL